MKATLILGLLILSCSISAHAEIVGDDGKNLRTNKDFIATCPETFLTYIDKSEGGPGAYCACPDENVGYIDKSEGGQGFYCSETPLN